MKIDDALTNRRSIRAFLDRPVPMELLHTLLATAARAPSGGNLQPWQIWVVTGNARQRLVDAVVARIDAGTPPEPEYNIYPPNLSSPYKQRRFAVGEAMYERLGITRMDKPARRAWFERNFRFFGAPVGLFCFVDRQMGPPQWADLGMYLQSLMLLLAAQGLGSCAQESWALYGPTVRQALGIGDHLMLYSGLAVGYPDMAAPVNGLVTDRLPVHDFVTFLDC
ncbi:nitroreductase [Niveispirillum sp. BGYR6]|uniref:nitroreductase n=1 Tax=Niveispirillum sp. BGYR6 TaxID=2971249 RepID=UPI0022B9CE60|nr:nitroreductase [Niveispirillum sp. BGYR6]MDG5498025.1 nitroreductase [Niveispirillum sp. BGYR6]